MKRNRQNPERRKRKKKTPEEYFDSRQFKEELKELLDSEQTRKGNPDMAAYTILREKGFSK